MFFHIFVNFKWVVDTETSIISHLKLGYKEFKVLPGVLPVVWKETLKFELIAFVLSGPTTNTMASSAKIVF